jgi:serine protease inhibitor
MKYFLILTMVIFSLGCESDSPDNTNNNVNNNINNENNLAGQYEELKSSVSRDENPDISADSFTIFMDSNTNFALKLYRALALDSEPTDNLVFSPFSISTALAMTWAGSSGETEQEMAEVLNFSFDQETTHAGFNKLIASMEAKGTGDVSEFAINIANSLWGNVDTIFGGPFLDTLALNYGAGLNLLDFINNPELARQIINAWVLQKTNGLINDLLPDKSISIYTRLVLVNAIHFLGKWNLQFDPKDTKPLSFYAPGGSYHTDFMTQTNTYHYAEGSDFKALELHYVDEDMSMLLVLPDDATAFTSWEATMDATHLNEIIETLVPNEVTVKIPKFEFESKFSLKEVLETMGMPKAFEIGRQDFLPIMPETNDWIFISDVYHKAFIAIDEKKTEAAAATAVVVNVNNTNGGAQEPLVFLADRPFIYFIRDRVTGAILFMGRITHPEVP